jgi:hypothetical protein
MSNVVSKAIQFERLQHWNYWWEGFMKYTVEMGSGGLIYEGYLESNFRLF